MAEAERGFRRVSNLPSTRSVWNVKCGEEVGAVVARLLCPGMALFRSGLDQLEQLQGVLRGYDSCLVAYSGGVDSVLLAVAAHRVLGERMLAAIADSPSLPRTELDEARSMASDFGFPLEVVVTREFDNPDYTSNPLNRCYFCKQELFVHLQPLAAARGLAVIAYGENASDLADFRPGARVAAEMDVRAPLREAGLSKAEIREMSRKLGLPTADKPEMPCLSSRIPHGEVVTREKLGMVEKAERVLRGMGFSDVRVRHHEAGPSARVEVCPEEVARLSRAEVWEEVERVLAGLGYEAVSFEEEGYRRGRVNGMS